MTAAAPPASRAMKARKRSRCHICHGAVLVGQRIVRVTVAGRQRWPHAACVVAARRDAVAGRPVVTVRLPERLARL